MVVDTQSEFEGIFLVGFTEEKKKKKKRKEKTSDCGFMCLGAGGARLGSSFRKNLAAACVRTEAP
jgi:hypothetical protein